MTKIDPTKGYRPLQVSGFHPKPAHSKAQLYLESELQELTRDKSWNISDLQMI